MTEKPLVNDVSRLLGNAKHSELWLSLSALFGFGGVMIALVLGKTGPAWCTSPFVGCIGEMVMSAVLGWMIGLVCAVKALGAEGKLRVMAWVLLIWNAFGSLLFFVVVATVASR